MDQHEQGKLFSEFPPVSTEEWEQRIITDLKGADYQKKLIWFPDEGFEVRPYYREEDMAGLETSGAVPGETPYIRGSRSQRNDWIIRQDFTEEEPSEINRQIREATVKGVNGVGIRAGKINTHKQMSEALSGLDIEKTEVNFISGPSYPLTLELFIYELMHRGTGRELVRGSINFDPAGYLLLHGKFYQTWQQNLEEGAYLLETIANKLPSFRAITINAGLFQNAGSTLVQELAFGLASACEYLAGFTDKGFSVDQVAPYMQISFATGPNYFLEIAKLRAARWLWARMVEPFAPALPKSCRVFLHSGTAKWNKSMYDPYVNMLRTTTEGMSSILGNADSVTIDPFNPAAGVADTFSLRIARNQQLVLKEEAYLDKIIDPSAGSYYIEKLTHTLATHAWDLFKKVESMGGLLQCIDSGFIRQEVALSRKKKEEDIARRRLILLGTNQFPNLQETLGSDTIPSGSDPAMDGAVPHVPPFRAASSFETIRIATERHVKSGNKRPSVFLLTMGNLAMLRARAGFATNFLGCAGYEIIDNPGFATAADGVAAALASGAGIVVICSSDEEYPVLVPDILLGFRQAGKMPMVVVAGYPKEHIEAFTAAGVGEFIHVRSDLLATLQRFHQYLSISGS